jgi:hypothetical protein
LFIHVGFIPLQLVSHSAMTLKAGIKKITDWMPEQVLHDEKSQY